MESPRTPPFHDEQFSVEIGIDEIDFSFLRQATIGNLWDIKLFVTAYIFITVCL